MHQQNQTRSIDSATMTTTSQIRIAVGMKPDCSIMINSGKGPLQERVHDTAYTTSTGDPALSIIGPGDEEPKTGVLAMLFTLLGLLFGILIMCLMVILILSKRNHPMVVQE